MSPKFKTPFNFKDDYITCSGTHTIDINKKKETGEKVVETGYEYKYKEWFDSDGKRHLIIAGRKNVYDEIQSFKNDVDIYKILERYTAGDISVLDKNKGFYIDCTKIPKDYNEYHNRIVDSQRIFDSLPIDFKEEFGKNINTFMNSIFDKSFEKKYDNYVERKRARFFSSNNDVVNNDVVNNDVVNNNIANNHVVVGGNDNAK